ncbi:hypothetical protein ASG67_10385 [Sphingomonas sp. Leaf339]|uniref:hypothetical protein n=1 Tax=Sphingomonas sp. Leaf339 TaxID=1736343 RepID=UPI0006F29F6B|nr:hypothetical protein [Sphingomonas sp. Leaf339]KQU53209.1 hypothetical protein ASG67_10385 [Sphingomonas sp. Leaf339]
MAASDDWTGKVANDMQGIFGSAGLAGDRIDDARLSGNAFRAIRTAAPRRHARWLTLGAPIAALVTAGFLFTQIDTASPLNAASTQHIAPRKIDHVAAFTAIAPSVQPRVEDAVLQTADQPSDVTPTTVAVEERMDAPRSVRVAPIPSEDSPLPAVRRMTVSTDAGGRQDGCRAGSNEDACIYRDVRAADRRLLAAYQRAVQAGVPRRDLVDIRRDWTRALAISLDDPDETIRRYDDLADQLRYLANTGPATRFASE